MPRPLLRRGTIGSQVRLLQRCLQCPVDGDFGSQTESAVRKFQRENGLSQDGVVGGGTWEVIEGTFAVPSYPPPVPPVLEKQVVDEISAAARGSAVASYAWKNRGKAPAAYLCGMAVAYAVDYLRWVNEDELVLEMCGSASGNIEKDALSWLEPQFAAEGMFNNMEGPETLRHLYAMMIGLGMRESSGKYCEGRDASATNVTADTAEAGLFQMSWNARSCCTDMQVLFDGYGRAEETQGYKAVFGHNVHCSEASWKTYGSGAGAKYQHMAKHLPLFACETTAIGLRHLRKHWGPVNRREVEVRRDVDDMLQVIETIVETGAQV